MVDLSASSIRVYLKIVRNTFGWRDSQGNVKKRDWISHSQFGNVGVSSRSVTNAIEQLLEFGLIRLTDYQGNDLSNPKERKLAKRIYYSPVVDNLENIALNKANTKDIPPQNLPTTKEILQKKYKANQRITDRTRIRRIIDEDQRKQIQRDSWL